MSPPNKGRTYPAQPLTREEVTALLAQCSESSATGLRNRAMIAVLYRTGLRCAELLALRPRDVDHAVGHLTVQRGKGGKSRTVGIDADALTLLEAWLDERRRLGISASRPLFCTLRGQRLDPSYLRRLLPRLGERAGIEHRCHPHGLRHTHAYQLAMEGHPLPAISAQLGHSSAAVTARYIDHIAPREVVAMIRSRPGWLD